MVPTVESNSENWGLMFDVTFIFLVLYFYYNLYQFAMVWEGKNAEKPVLKVQIERVAPLQGKNKDLRKELVF